MLRIALMAMLTLALLAGPAAAYDCTCAGPPEGLTPIELAEHNAAGYDAIFEGKVAAVALQYAWLQAPARAAGRK